MKILKCSPTVRKVIIVKSIVMIGLLSAYYLPTEHAMMANALANLLWLWRT